MEGKEPKDSKENTRAGKGNSLRMQEAKAFATGAAIGAASMLSGVVVCGWDQFKTAAAFIAELAVIACAFLVGRVFGRKDGKR